MTAGKWRIFGKVYGRLLPYVRPHRARLAVAAVLTLAYIGVGLLRPWPIKVLIDQVILGKHWGMLPGWLDPGSHPDRLLWVSCLAILVLAGLAGLLGYFRTVLVAVAGQRVVAKLREDLHDRLLQLSLAFHGRQRSGDLLVRIAGDTVMMRQLLVEGLFAVGQELLMVAGVLAVMTVLEPLLALLAALVVPLIVGLMYVYGRRLRATARRQRKKEGQIGAAINESLSAIPVIQAYSLEEQAAKRFASRNRKSLKAGVAGARLEAKLSGWTEVAIATGVTLTLLVGVGKVRAGALSPGELLVVLSYVRALYKPLRKAVTRSSRLFKSAACGERVLKVLDTRPDLELPEEPVPLGILEGELRFENLSFSYPGKGRVLEGLDLRIRPGETVGLYGPNGSGKSTLASFVPRLRDPELGRVLLDGKDLRALDLAELRRAVAVVFQDTLLFDGSLRENLRMGRPEASDEEIERAAEEAGVTEFAARFPDGLETEVGERGVALSGGQRQRIALARALLRDAKVVILDEPTAGLDAKSEANFAERLLRKLRGRTVLLITHDKKLAGRLDRVLRLENGRAVELRPDEAPA